MPLFMLIGFAGVVVVLGFLSCMAGSRSEGRHLRGGRGEVDDWKRRARR